LYTDTLILLDILSELHNVKSLGHLPSFLIERLTETFGMDDVRHLHSVLLLRAGARKPERRMEIPTKTQAEVLSTFGHYVDAGGVLQPMSV
jgi:hypothetical protein